MVESSNLLCFDRRGVVKSGGGRGSAVATGLVLSSGQHIVRIAYKVWAE